MALQDVLVHVCCTLSGYFCAGRVAETLSAAPLASYKFGAKPWGVSPQAGAIAEGQGTALVPDT